MKIIQTIIHDTTFWKICCTFCYLTKFYWFMVLLVYHQQLKRANKMSHALLNVSVYKLTTFSKSDIKWQKMYVIVFTIQCARNDICPLLHKLSHFEFRHIVVFLMDRRCHMCCPILNHLVNTQNRSLIPRERDPQTTDLILSPSNSLESKQHLARKELSKLCQEK